MRDESDEAADHGLKEMAYHYEPYWDLSGGAHLKSLLLFFDGVAVTVPGYMRDAPLLTDPVLAQPLAEQGLLVQLSPETLLDEIAAETIAASIDELLAAGAFDDIGKHHRFTELSMSRLGNAAASHLAGDLINRLQERGLALPSEDGVSVPLHPVVRAFVLTLLPQLLREPAERSGYALQPTTTLPQQLAAFMKVLDTPTLPTAGHVVSADLQQVGLDLSSIPLDEVLDFRTTHGAAFRTYARDLRRFVRDMSTFDEQARQEAISDRQEELADAAASLLRTSRTAWNRPLLSVGLGIAGSAVSLSAGNVPAAVISALSALVGLKRQADPDSAYSYLLRVDREVTGRTG